MDNKKLVSNSAHRRFMNWISNTIGWDSKVDPRTQLYISREVALNKLRKSGWIDKNNKIINNKLLRSTNNTVSKNPIITKSSTITTPRFLSKYSNMSNVIGGANNIKAWQEKLKNYYAPNTYNPDSIWGDNTQAAYEKYLEDQTKQNIKFGASDMIADINDTSGLEKAKEVVPNYETTYFDPHAKELFDKVVLRNPGYNFNYNPYSSFTFNTPLTFNKPITFSKQGSKLLKKNSINKFKKGRNLVPNFR